MLNQNRTRRDFAERLQNIINNYNADSSSADANFDNLVRFAQELREEAERHIRKGLTAKALLKRLTEESPKVLIQDWFKDSQTRLAVRDEVSAVLDKHLPEDSYDNALFVEKRDKIFELTLDLAINNRKWAA